MAKKSGAKRLGGKFSEFAQMSRENKQRALYTLLLNNAMYIIIVIVPAELFSELLNFLLNIHLKNRLNKVRT